MNMMNPQITAPALTFEALEDGSVCLRDFSIEEINVFIFANFEIYDEDHPEYDEDQVAWIREDLMMACP